MRAASLPCHHLTIPVAPKTLPTGAFHPQLGLSWPPLLGKPNEASTTKTLTAVTIFCFSSLNGDIRARVEIKKIKDGHTLRLKNGNSKRTVNLFRRWVGVFLEALESFYVEGQSESRSRTLYPKTKCNKKSGRRAQMSREGKGH